MVGPDDVIQWKDIATGGAFLLAGGTAFIVKQFTKRLDDHEKEDRETFKAIFEGQRDIAKQINDGQRDLSAQIGIGLRDLADKLSSTHIQLLERISDVQQGKNDT